MNIYEIVNKPSDTELFLGMFESDIEIDSQFKKNVKGTDIYLFCIDPIGVSDDGVTIVCPMDKKTQVIPFNSIIKIKCVDTGDILEVDKYKPVDKSEITNHFISGGDPRTLCDSNFLPRDYDEVNIKAGTVSLIDSQGDSMMAVELFELETTLKFEQFNNEIASH